MLKPILSILFTLLIFLSTALPASSSVPSRIMNSGTWPEGVSINTIEDATAIAQTRVNKLWPDVYLLGWEPVYDLSGQIKTLEVVFTRNPGSTLQLSDLYDHVESYGGQIRGYLEQRAHLDESGNQEAQFANEQALQKALYKSWGVGDYHTVTLTLPDLEVVASVPQLPVFVENIVGSRNNQSPHNLALIQRYISDVSGDGFVVGGEKDRPVFYSDSRQKQLSKTQFEKFKQRTEMDPAVRPEVVSDPNCRSYTAIITHGFKLNGGFSDPETDWPRDMAIVINERCGGDMKLFYYNTQENKFECSDPVVNGGPNLFPCDRGGQKGNILVMNWTKASNDPERGFSEAAGEALFAAIMHGPKATDSKYKFSLNQSGYLHLIGHSRGTVVTSETVERLLVSGIKVDQVTNLDPHDWGLSGGPGRFGTHTDYDVNPILVSGGQDEGVVAWKGIGWADTYYQIDEGFPDLTSFIGLSGRQVAGTYNIELEDDWKIQVLSCIHHSNIYHWYIGTIKKGGYPRARSCFYGKEGRPIKTESGFRYTIDSLANPGVSPCRSDPVCDRPGERKQTQFSFASPMQGIVNGNFRRNGGNLPPQLPGFSYFGGTVPNAFGSLNGDWYMLEAARTLRHNYIYIPPGVDGVSVRYKQGNGLSSAHTLRLLLNGVVLDSRTMGSNPSGVLAGPLLSNSRDKSRQKLSVWLSGPRNLVDGTTLPFVYSHVLVKDLQFSTPDEIVEPGSNCGTASDIALNSEVSGVIWPKTDVDFFRLVLSQSGKLTVQTVGAIDTTGFLYDGNCSQLAGNTNGGQGKNFKLKKTLSSGTYFVKVNTNNKATAGEYLLINSFEHTDHGGNCAKATNIAPNDMISGKIYPIWDDDTFRVVLPEDGVLTVQSRGTTNTTGYLYDASCKKITGNADGGEGKNFKIGKSLSAGAYYIFVNSALRLSTGYYELSSAFTPKPLVDFHGGTCSSATLINPNESVSGSIIPKADLDFFKIVLPKAGKLVVSTGGTTNTWGWLMNGSCTTIANSGSGGAGSNFKITKTLNAGTYYVQVNSLGKKTTGNYQLNSSFTPASTSDDHGGRCDAATSVPPNSTKHGTINPKTDLDFFKIVLSQAGTLVLNTSGSLDTYGYLKNSSCTNIANNNDGGSGSNFRISKALAVGTYYVRVNSFGLSNTGDYVLNSSFTPTAIQSKLSVVVRGSGSVTSEPAGINCPGKCESFFQVGERVTLLSNPNEGSYLESWSGLCPGSGFGVCQLPGIFRDRQATATFQSRPASSDLRPTWAMTDGLIAYGEIQNVGLTTSSETTARVFSSSDAKISEDDQELFQFTLGPQEPENSWDPYTPDIFVFDIFDLTVDIGACFYVCTDSYSGEYRDNNNCSVPFGWGSDSFSIEQCGDWKD